MDGESYVVRIYKRRAAAANAHARGSRSAENLVGIVESTLDGQRSSFHDIEELWAIFARRAKASSRTSVRRPVRNGDSTKEGEDT
jgi:hypothetical protein